MHMKVESRREEILDRITEIATGRHGGAMLDVAEARTLLEFYYRHVAVEDLEARDPVDLYGAAMSQYRTGSQRQSEESLVRVFTPSVEEHGWSADGHTVVELVTDDMPFLVDSMTMCLARQSHAIHMVIHPQMHVRRDGSGKITELCTRSAAGDDDVLVESWMHVEIDRETNEEDLAAIEADLRKMLTDVRSSVADWRSMRAKALEVVDALESDPPPLPAREIEETRELLRWLAEEHFTFLGYREYELVDSSGDDELRGVSGSGMGILRPDGDVSTAFGRLPAEARRKAREKTLLVVTKGNSRSTVHRPAYLDYIGVKQFDASGEVVGERRFIGLFTSTAYTEKLHNIPVLRSKVDEIMERTGYESGSHSGKSLMDVLETYPRDEMFQTSVDELLPIAEAVLQLQERRQLRLFARRDEFGRYLSCLVYVPRDRYTTEIRLRMESILRDKFDAETVDYAARVSDSVLARLHVVVRVPQGETIGDFDVNELEAELRAATRTWEDDFADAIRTLLGEEEGPRLLREYADGFPAAFKEDFPARVAVADVRRLEEAASSGELALSLYEPVDAPIAERRFKVFRVGEALSLSEVLPHLNRMGVEVVDERPYEVVRRDGNLAFIYDFGLRWHAGADSAEARDLFQDTFAAVWRGQAESDRFNALVTIGGLTWRQVSILRAYAKYLRQGRMTFSQDYIEEALIANVDIARQLVELFEARFGLDSGGQGEASRSAAQEAVTDRIESALDDVASLDQDRIIRSYLAVIRATLRTNHYQLDADGNHKSYTSFKLEPRSIPDLPDPRPMFEIFVYSPRVEGVHLRFGPVARGGLRWSDRREDFRTEVLGLVKAQMVKNTVIVPTGSKGGFFPKHLPDPSVDREAWLDEGIACYKTFISGLLDLTDNLVDDRAVPPRQVVRHDGDDTYLVVAADKGTATFSDIANGVSIDYGFWLGDAFASGGSVGYDHKGMGITARGAWESVKRHFREVGIDCQSEDFTCVGVGDMSGDVFGNGMLLSEHIRLLAAFDHRHVFLDPDPDSATSWTERKRIFDLPRSTWEDYNPDLISEGGGIHSLKLKSIEITPQVREALGLDDKLERMTPLELKKAIIAAPVDLFWNGGIGTYVKASTETHADVGDKANDSIRVDGDELRCKAIGEGGNLGMTQRGRIEFAMHGGRVNTDFIDNSAGVDTSDHEVNIKILLDKIVASGDMTAKQRNEFLASMTEEVGLLVLRNNYDQNIALSNAGAQAPGLMHVHADVIDWLGKEGLLDRELEFLPTEAQITQRRAEGQGLTMPEMCVLLPYMKIHLNDELMATDLADDEYLVTRLYDYFPKAMRSEQMRARVDEHPLRKEIIITVIVNELVNNAGTTFLYRLISETGASAEDLTRANIAAREIFDLPAIIAATEELDNVVDADVQTRMRLEARTLAERASRWLVSNRRPPIDITANVEHFAECVAAVVPALPEVIGGRERTMYEERLASYVEVGVPEELAARVAVLAPAYSALGIVETARRDDVDPMEVAAVHFAVGELLGLGRLVEKILALPRDDRWRTMARAALRDDLQAVHVGLTAQVLASTSADSDPHARAQQWQDNDNVVVDRAVSTLNDICEEDREPDLARMSVGLRVVRNLLAAPS